MLVLTSQQTPEDSFEIPQRKRPHRVLVTLIIVVLLCAAVLVAYEWKDIAYVLPDSLKGSPSQVELAAVSDEGELPLYVYGTLSEEDQEKYRLVYRALSEKSKVAFPTDNRNELRRIAEYVQADYPQFADTAAAVMVEGGVFTPAYVAGVPLASDDEAASLQAQIDEAASDCFAGILDGADDYEKAKHVFEWLSGNVSYGGVLEEGQDRIVIKASGNTTFTLDEGSSIPREHGQTVYNALVEGKAVCAGYARAYQYLLQRLGIESATVFGTAQGNLHAWCLAKLDGSYYYIDPTWGDPEYEGEQPADSDSTGADYAYFAVTTADLAPTHVLEDAFTLPTCDAMADNYFVREGLMFDEADADRLASLAFKALGEGRQLSIRCTSREVHDDLLHNWVETGELGQLALIERYRYSSSDEGVLTITLWPVEELGEAAA